MRHLKDQLIEELWWDIHKLGYWPDNDRILSILQKAYEIGYKDGSLES